MFGLSKILPFLAHYFVGLGEALIGSAAAKSLEAGIVNFVKTDVGGLAIDAVEYASTLGVANADAHAAAVTKFKSDLTAAGHDITTLATSTADLFIQVAYNYVKGTVASIVPPVLPTAAPAAAPVTV